MKEEVFSTLTMSLKLLIAQLWIVGMVLQALLAMVLLARKTWKTFPIFTAYSIYSCLVSVGMYALRPSGPVYLNLYSVEEIVGILLGFGVIYEIFRTLLNSYPALRNLARLVFQCMVVALVALGCIVLYVQSSTEHNPFLAAMLTVQEATRTIEVGLLLFLFLFASAFGLHWRQYVFGVALGIGLFISVDLILVTMRLHVGYVAQEVFSITRALAFNLSLVMWLGYLLAPESKTQRMDVPKLSQLEQWNQALMELIHQ